SVRPPPRAQYALRTTPRSSGVRARCPARGTRRARAPATIARAPAWSWRRSSRTRSLPEPGPTKPVDARARRDRPPREVADRQELRWSSHLRCGHQAVAVTEQDDLVIRTHRRHREQQLRLVGGGDARRADR